MNTFGETKPTFIPLDSSENQFQIYEKISGNYTHTFLLESLTGPKELAETSIIGFDPDVILQGFKEKIIIKTRQDTKTIKTNDPLNELKKLVGKNTKSTYRYIGGAVGFVNYDAIRLWEDIPSRYADMPIMEFGIYKDGILYDNKLKKPFYFYYQKNRLDDIKFTKNKNTKVSISEITPNLSLDDFTKIIDKAKKYIYDGDIFQVVLSRKFNFKINGNHLQIYKKLRELNPSPYLYHLKMGDKTIIGASPEMLIRITEDIIETFPIAGTRKITDDQNKNDKLKKELLHDQKEIAEHTMLVDLGRNDIGRICKFGTVSVKDLMQVKQFSHVQHMTSHVTGILDKKYDMYDAFKSVFPAGTVTGAPKIRAMQIIDELEDTMRGPYAGAVGYFSFNGCCDFAIAIRSIFIDKDVGFIQAGAGIVNDSIPENEFKETQHKAEAMISALKEAAN